MLLGVATDDALTAGNEAKPGLDEGIEVAMWGGRPGTFNHGEWTYDIDARLIIATIAVEGFDLRPAESPRPTRRRVAGVGPAVQGRRMKHPRFHLVPVG